MVSLGSIRLDDDPGQLRIGEGLPHCSQSFALIGIDTNIQKKRMVPCGRVPRNRVPALVDMSVEVVLMIVNTYPESISRRLCIRRLRAPLKILTL